jgi:hypothetical protein
MDQDQSNASHAATSDTRSATRPFAEAGRAAEERLADDARREAEQLRAGVEQARSEIARLEQRARELVRERPVGALLAAVAAGYLVGRIATRRSS